MLRIRYVHWSRNGTRMLLVLRETARRLDPGVYRRLFDADIQSLPLRHWGRMSGWNAYDGVLPSRTEKMRN